MKNKDYVGQTKSKKSKPPVPDRRPFPVVKGVVTLTLLAAFGYFLTEISSNSTQDKIVEEKTPSSKKQTKQVELPPPPVQPDWTPEGELEHKTVDVKPLKLEDKGPFKMQCASYKNEDDAYSLKARIAFAGYESDVRKSVGSNGVWYKVVLGPFEKKREAEKIRHVLKRNNIPGCQIWLWR